MIYKYRFGHPFNTEAIVKEIPASEGMPAYGTIRTESGFCYTYTLSDQDKIYGLGEQTRGINKRGYSFTSWASDNPHHQEDTHSLYGAHNFLIVSGRQTFGLFLDFPGEMTFDLGYTHMDLLSITCKKADLDLYVFTGENLLDIVKQFRGIIGRSYIPPKFAFGFGQCRWSYMNEDEIREVVKKHREAGVPLDMVYMDIDYMDHYKDFTVNGETFPDLPAFVQELKEQHVRLVPIIDAGVKIEKNYDVYEEGVEKGYFCKRKDGSNFVAAVWPGYTHFPDVLNPEARRWFGDKYKVLTDMGIEAFWNDMNEPALFYTPEGVADAQKMMTDVLKTPTADLGTADGEMADMPVWDLQAKINGLANNREDYARMYHNVDGQLVCHEEVHNLFGYNMTRAAGEALERMYPDKRMLLFSRSSYVGMHRYGGIWMGDNNSWWSHILMNLQMLPSLNMCGFLYTGADLGGFAQDSGRDLVLRWLALGVFTPLMRNHSALGTRRQEFYQFDRPEDFEKIITVRYRLIPYIYSEFMKAALHDDMMFKPLAFEYAGDPIAEDIQDQLLLGNELMIAPIYTQNAAGRYVYLPEQMMLVKFCADGTIEQKIMDQGVHYIKADLNEVFFFIRSGKAIPLAPKAECVEQIDYNTLRMVGFTGASYNLYNDDGFSRDYLNRGRVILN